MGELQYFVELDKTTHKRQAFDCGQDTLNRFIQQYAARHRQAGISKTMVLANSEYGIRSFYTLSHTVIQRHSLPKNQTKKLPFYPIPVLIIGQLAVHKKEQGTGLGKVTLIKALQHCYEIHQVLPSFAVIVDAIDGSAVSFYQQYGFSLLESAETTPIRLWLSMKAIETLFEV